MADSLRDAAVAFLAKYKECEPYLTSAFFMAYTNRGSQYTGPNWAAELADLRAAIVDAHPEGQDRETGLGS